MREPPPREHEGALQRVLGQTRVAQDPVGDRVMPTTDTHPERRRLYFMDPATMTGATAREFLPGNPPSGKLNADVSANGKQVVFMDTGDPAVV